ncbi:MAG: 4Fe-4S dicluster domain-containing protein [Gammaproteobacteria bacterium]|nr:4Fe-4S dicluster domain-containing protein [Gammaproteobacteria bacterium]
MHYKLDIDTNIENILNDVGESIDAKEVAYEVSMGKRDFLRSAAAVGGLAIAPGVLLYQTASAKPAAQAVSGKQRWGMLINTNICQEDCDACVTACNEEHGLWDLGRPQTDAQWIRKLNVKDKQTGHVTSLPMMCQHCEHPPCVDVCPTGASFKREDGIVLVNAHTCIGCRYCMMACPYKARSFIHESLEDQLPHAPRGKGTVESCTLCVHKVDRGDNNTACAEACAKDGHNALLFGDLNDPNSEISKQLEKHGGVQIRADLDLNTGVRYQGL